MRGSGWIVAVGVGAGLLAGCSSSSSGGASAPSSPTSTPSVTLTSTPTPTPSLTGSPIASLPHGFVPFDYSHLNLGVPQTWITVPVGTSASTVRRLERKYPTAKSRLSSDSGTTQQGAKMFAIDPHSSTNQVLVLTFSTPGVTTSRSGLEHIFTSSIEPNFATSNIRILTHTLTTIGGRDSLRITANYVKNGSTVREVIDFVSGNGELYDLTFTGDPVVRAQIESTLAIT
jgi:hypothetical protein